MGRGPAVLPLPKNPTPASALRATSPVCPWIFLHPSGRLTPPTFLRTPRPIWVGNPPWGSSLGTDAEAAPGIYWIDLHIRGVNGCRTPLPRCMLLVGHIEVVEVPVTRGTAYLLAISYFYTWSISQAGWCSRPIWLQRLLLQHASLSTCRLVSASLSYRGTLQLW